MRDMSKVYAHMSDDDLIKRRANCVMELARHNAGKSLWRDREARVLEYIIHQIDTERTYRMYRNALPMQFE